MNARQFLKGSPEACGQPREACKTPAAQDVRACDTPHTMFGLLQSNRFLRVLISDRHICARSLPKQIERLAGLIDVVILREKDMQPSVYALLLQEVSRVCAENSIALVAHQYTQQAKAANCTALHLPLPQLIASGGRPKGFAVVGTNVHAVSEVSLAESMGADYLIASPIFQPTCKPDAAPQGIVFLETIIAETHLPVLALGGINDACEPAIHAAGATGACRLSDYLTR